MRFPSAVSSAIQIVAALTASHSLWAQAPAIAREAQGLTARAAPADYQVHAKVGQVTLAAEFTGHGIPNTEEPLYSEDHVAVEVAIFGPPGAHLTITASDFSLKINRKRDALPSQPWVLAAKSIKDPEWVSPEAETETKSKGGVSGSGGGGGGREMGAPSPLPPKVPVDMLRGWQQRVGKAAIAEGDRALPQAGLIFFQYRGKTENIRTMELLYEGPAGKVALRLL